MKHNIGEPMEAYAKRRLKELGAPEEGSRVVIPAFFRAGSGGGAPGGGGILRAVSSFNRLGDSVQSGSAGFAMRFAFRISHVIGSGDVSEIRIKLDNWTTNGSTLFLPGNTVTYSNMWLEGTSAVAAIKIGGASSRVMGNGEADVVGDSILPSSFGLSKFSIGERYFIRGLADIPIGAGSRLIFNGRIGGLTPDNTDTQCKSFDPSVTACNNLAATGPLTFTGTAPTDANAPSIQLVGKFITGDPRVWLGVGDSITNDTDDRLGAPAKIGSGFFTRACYNNGVDPVACINSGIGSSTINIWTLVATQLNTLRKYCNSATYMYGTNSFDGAANNPGNLTSVINADRAYWLATRTAMGTASGTQKTVIIGLPLIPRCVAAGFDSSSTSSQTVFGPKWDVGGDVDSLNSSRLSDVGVANRLDAFCDTGTAVRADPSSNANLDYHKYAPSTGSDGTHPTATGHSAMATLLRATMDSLPPTLNP